MEKRVRQKFLSTLKHTDDGHFIPFWLHSTIPVLPGWAAVYWMPELFDSEYDEAYDTAPHHDKPKTGSRIYTAPLLYWAVCEYPLEEAGNPASAVASIHQVIVGQFFSFNAPEGSEFPPLELSRLAELTEYAWPDDMCSHYRRNPLDEHFVLAYAPVDGLDASAEKFQIEGDLRASAMRTAYQRTVRYAMWEARHEKRAEELRRSNSSVPRAFDDCQCKRCVLASRYPLGTVK